MPTFTTATQQLLRLAEEAGLHPTVGAPYSGSIEVSLDEQAGPDSTFGVVYVGASTGKVLRAALVHGGGRRKERFKGLLETRRALVAYRDRMRRGR